MRCDIIAQAGLATSPKSSPTTDWCPLTSQPTKRGLSRRHVLFGTAALIAASSVSAPAFALSPSRSPLAANFLKASQLLVNHRLNPATAARMAAFAEAQTPDCAALLDQIIAAAAAKNTQTVEEFFPDLPEGPVRDFAYWIIQTWYLGSSSGERGATLFTYEEALLYQPTLDMVPIPTFGFSAPNAWGNDLYPLTDLPRF